MTTTNKTFHTDGLSFQGPGTYRIRIIGTLDHHWFDCFGDMRCTTSQTTEGKLVTTLVGHFRDQAALLGLLNTLYDLHLPLLQVEYVTEPSDEQKDSGA
jgi:hypothetical protein